MGTISFSVDEQTSKQIAAWAKEAGTSKSDVLRDMARHYKLQRQWRDIQQTAQEKAREHGLQSEDDVEAFLG